MDGFFSNMRPGMTVIGLIYELLSLFYDEEAVVELFDGFDIQRAKVVVDSNILLTDLKYYIQKKHHTGLMAAAKIGGVRLFASAIVRDEVAEKLDTYMSKYGIDLCEAQQVWNTSYVPWISFLDPSDLPPLSSKVKDLLARDPDDVPTGQIIELIGPHLVLSRDNDLAKFESIGQDIPIITCAYRDKTKRDAVALGINLGGGFVLFVSWETIKSFVAFIYGLGTTVSIGLLVLALGSLGVALFYSPSRNWLWKHSRHFIKSLWEGLGPLVDELMEIEAASVAAKPITSQFQRSITAPKTARDYAAIVLSEAFGPLRAKEITRRMIAYGYKTSSEHPHYYISRVLHKYPRLFEMLEGEYWQLRSHLPNVTEEAV